VDGRSPAGWGGLGNRSPNLSVMPGLDPGIHPGGRIRARWILGSSPRMTGELYARRLHQAFAARRASLPTLRVRREKGRYRLLFLDISPPACSPSIVLPRQEGVSGPAGHAGEERRLRLRAPELAVPGRRLRALRGACVSPGLQAARPALGRGRAVERLKARDGFWTRRFFGGGEARIRKGTDPARGCGPPATGARLLQSSPSRRAWSAGRPAKLRVKPTVARRSAPSAVAV